MHSNKLGHGFYHVTSRLGAKYRNTDYIDTVKINIDFGFNYHITHPSRAHLKMAHFCMLQFKWWRLLEWFSCVSSVPLLFPIVPHTEISIVSL